MWSRTPKPAEGQRASRQLEEAPATQGPGQEDGAQLAQPALWSSQPARKALQAEWGLPIPRQGQRGGQQSTSDRPGPGPTASPATNPSTSRQRLMVPSTNLGTHPGRLHFQAHCEVQGQPGLALPSKQKAPRRVPPSSLRQPVTPSQLCLPCFHLTPNHLITAQTVAVGHPGSPCTGS